MERALLYSPQRENVKQTRLIIARGTHPRRAEELTTLDKTRFATADGLSVEITSMGSGIAMKSALAVSWRPVETAYPY